MKSTTILMLSFLFVCMSCQQNTPVKKVPSPKETPPIQVFNFDNERDRAAYQALKLDSSHPNLLNPQIAPEMYTEVRSSWSELHQNIGTYLSEKEFSWGVKDSTITIVQKFYFTPEGQIKSYFFNIRNKNVTDSIKQQFGKYIADFAKDHRIMITRETPFAQCGKTKYLN